MFDIYRSRNTSFRQIFQIWRFLIYHKLLAIVEYESSSCFLGLWLVRLLVQNPCHSKSWIFRLLTKLMSFLNEGDNLFLLSVNISILQMLSDGKFILLKALLTRFRSTVSLLWHNSIYYSLALGFCY